MKNKNLADMVGNNPIDILIISKETDPQNMKATIDGLNINKRECNL